MIDCGPVKRWWDGAILHAANDWISMAYMVTDDPDKLRGFRMGFEGPDQICVVYIDRKVGELWKDVE